MTTRPQRLAAPPETVDDDPLVTGVMSTHLVAIRPDAPLTTALRVMASAGVRHLPVIDGERCLGVVVESDLVHRLAAGYVACADGSPLLVGDLTRAADPVPVTARRSDAARRMQAEDTDVALVVNRGQLVGVVTATDLIHSLAGIGPTGPSGEQR